MAIYERPYNRGREGGFHRAGSQTGNEKRKQKKKRGVRFLSLALRDKKKRDQSKRVKSNSPQTSIDSNQKKEKEVSCGWYRWRKSLPDKNDWFFSS